MSKARIVIIEDEFFAADHLAEEVANLGFSIAGIYHSGEEFLSETDWDFDAAVVDIFLESELSGLDIGVELKERNKPFIFLTANQDQPTLKEAASLGPKAYISKPFKSIDIQVALEIISLELAQKIEIHDNHGKSHISPHDIIYIKSDGVYVEIRTKKEKIIERRLLKEMETELPENFIRIHRSFLINKDFIDEKKSNHVIVAGFEIPISRSYKWNV